MRLKFVLDGSDDAWQGGAGQGLCDVLIQCVVLSASPHAVSWLELITISSAVGILTA